MRLHEFLTEEELEELKIPKSIRNAGLGLAGMAAMTGIGAPAAADISTDASAQPASYSHQIEKKDVKTQIKDDITKLVNQNLDWDKLPWYAPSKGEVMKMIIGGYFKIINNNGSLDEMVPEIQDYLTDPGAIDQLQKMFGGHTTMTMASNAI